MGGALAYVLKHDPDVDVKQAVSTLQKCRQGEGIKTPEGGSDWVNIFHTLGGASFKQQGGDIYTKLKEFSGSLDRLHEDIIPKSYNTNPGWKEKR